MSKENVPRIILDVVKGHKLDLDVTGSVIDSQERETMRGAPVFTLVIHDPDYALLESEVLFEVDKDGDRDVRPIDIEVDEDRWFRLVQVSWAPASQGRGCDITLTFEHRIVAYLRRHRRPKKASRAKMTRAQFVQTFAREVKADRIRFVSPELTKTQPIAKKTKQQQDNDREPALGEDTVIMVKKRRATRTQRRVIEAVLQVAESAHIPRKLQIVAIMVITQESVAGLRTVSISGKHFGPFHQDESYGTEKQRRDPAHAATEFFNRLLPFYRQNPDLDPEVLAEAIQKSGQGSQYAQWRAEAEETVAAFSGTGTESRSYSKQYAFTRGVNGEREDSWECAQRLAEQVGWRCFVAGRRSWYFISEPTLFKSRARLTVSRDNPAVLEVRGDIDTGKKDRTIRIRVRWADWSAPAGSVVIVKGYGVADGRWLVEEISGSLFSTERSVTLKKPTKPKPEPRPDEGSTTDRNEATSDEIGSAGRLYRECKKISDAGGPYVYGGGHGPLLETLSSGQGLDCSSSSSLALWRAGLFEGDRAITSGEFARSWGRPGKGKTFTVWANAQHVWIEFHNVGPADVPRVNANRFDTSPYGSGGRGPRLRFKERPTSGFTPRHWDGM